MAQAAEERESAVNLHQIFIGQVDDQNVIFVTWILNVILCSGHGEYT